jgi:hypothetical protein
MTKNLKYLVLFVFSISLLACNLSTLLQKTAEPVLITPETVASNTPLVIQPTTVPTLVATVEVQAASQRLDPCALITSAEAEGILAEPVSAPNAMSGTCSFSNAKDSLYMVSVAAAQDADTNGMLQGQAMLMGFAGAQLDEARMTKLKSMAASMDFTGFFTELVTAAQGTPTLKAKLIDKDGQDLTYWTWQTADTRRQGDYVAVRGNTLVNINLIVADTQTEEAMLAAAGSLADQVFGRLPAKFSLAVPSASATQVVESVSTPTLVGLVLLPAPKQTAPANGVSIDKYPRTTTLKWEAVPGAVKYVVEIQGCEAGNPSTCFSHPMYENSSRETTTTSYTFTFMGMQPGQWRVWAVDAKGLAGELSPWWTFTYLK